MVLQQKIFILASLIFINFALCKGQKWTKEILLTEEEKTKIESAGEFVKKADEIMLQVANLEQGFLSELKNRKTREKAEKKSFEAKKMRIEAILNYEKAYKTELDIYSEKFELVEFVDTADERRVKEINLSATKREKTAGRKTKRYGNMKNGDIKDKKYFYLIRDLKKVKETYKNVLKEKKHAYELCLSQVKKDEQNKMEAKAMAEKHKKEALVWKFTQKANSYYAVNDYLKQFPSGKYLAFAKLVLEDFAAPEMQTANTEKYRLCISAKHMKENNAVFAELKKHVKFEEKEINKKLYFVPVKDFDHILEAVVFILDNSLEEFEPGILIKRVPNKEKLLLVNFEM